jgi:hypothetical protein
MARAHHDLPGLPSMRLNFLLAVIQFVPAYCGHDSLTFVEPLQLGISEVCLPGLSLIANHTDAPSL